MATNATKGKDEAEGKVKESVKAGHCLTMEVSWLLQICVLTDRCKFWDWRYRMETKHPMSTSEICKLFCQYSNVVDDPNRLLIQQQKAFNRRLVENRPLTEIQNRCSEIWNDEIKDVGYTLREIGFIIGGVHIHKYAPVRYHGVKFCDGNCDNEINKRLEDEPELTQDGDRWT